MVTTRIPSELAPDLLERLKQRFGAFPLTREWDLNIEALAPGSASMSLIPNGVTSNGPAGALNGGVLATLADMACALALSTCFDGRMPFATSDLHIRYLEPADSEVTIAASVVRVSLRSAILDCRLTCAGRIVALCTTHFIIKLRAKETP